MTRKNFIKNKENFICFNCGQKIQGTGYTNHCPKCLYSKHVDLKVPGDRANSCGGLMKPVGIEKKGKEYIILHQCERCGEKKRNKTSSDDDFEIIIKISKVCQE